MREDSTIIPRRRHLWLVFVAGIIAALLPNAATAASYGSVEVEVPDDPQGESNHGYVEIWVVIRNRSETNNHEVKLTLPKSSDSGYGDYLRAITRTVTVEAGKTVRVSLAYPTAQMMAGSGLGVAIDGKEQEEFISVRDPSRGGSYGLSTKSAYSSSSRFGSALVLYSKSVDTKFRDWAVRIPAIIREIESDFPKDVKIPGGPGSQPVDAFASSRVPLTEFIRANLPAAAWSPNWLGYSRFDGVVVTADDLRSMPAEVRAAIGQFVECGGTLLILGADAPLPGAWKPLPINKLPLSGCPAGFGHCFITLEKEYWEMNPAALTIVMNSWQRTGDPFQRIRTPGEANRVFPVINDTLGVSIWGLLGLMLVFAIVIGPVNLFVLDRRKRKLWLFWTVPFISFITCVVVLGYMFLTESRQASTRTETLTVLDENSRRASTIGWFAVYTPMLGGGGLHFSPLTELTYQNEDSYTSSSSYPSRRRRSGSALTIDWTNDQNLASGWQTPRVPSHFMVRKSESRRERVAISVAGDGRLEAVNGLGADITNFWYLDVKGTYYNASNITAGGRAYLNPTAKPASTESSRTLRALYSRDWQDMSERLKSSGPDFLTPRTYLAFVAAAPFLDDAAAKGSAVKAKSIILGIVKEGSDGN